MILIFDYFETILNTKSMDFNRGLYVFWESYYREKCPFEDMKKYGEDLFEIFIFMICCNRHFIFFIIAFFNNTTMFIAKDSFRNAVR